MIEPPQEERTRYIKAQLDICRRLGAQELFRRYRLNMFPCEKHNDEIKFEYERRMSKQAWDNYYRAKDAKEDSDPVNLMTRFILGYVSMKILLGGFRR